MCTLSKEATEINKPLKKITNISWTDRIDVKNMINTKSQTNSTIFKDI